MGRAGQGRAGQGSTEPCELFSLVSGGGTAGARSTSADAMPIVRAQHFVAEILHRSGGAIPSESLLLSTLAGSLAKSLHFCFQLISSQLYCTIVLKITIL
jgi:hypothetical protein